MSMAKLLSSILLQQLSFQHQPRPRLLTTPIPFQQQQLSASLARRRCRPSRHLFLTSTLNPLTKQLIVLSKAKNPLNSISSHLQVRPRPRSPKVPLVFLTVKKLLNPVLLSNNRLLRQKETAAALGFHHLLHSWTINPSLVNLQPRFLPPRRQNRRKPSPKRPQPKQLYLRSRLVFSINQQPRQLPLSSHGKPLHCSGRPEQSQMPMKAGQTRSQFWKKQVPKFQLHSRKMQQASLQLPRLRRLPYQPLSACFHHQSHSLKRRISLQQHPSNSLPATTKHYQRQKLNQLLGLNLPQSSRHLSLLPLRCHFLRPPPKFSKQHKSQPRHRSRSLRVHKLCPARRRVSLQYLRQARNNQPPPFRN